LKQCYKQKVTWSSKFL